MASQSYNRFETTQRRHFSTNSKSSSTRSGLGYWLPLILTIGVATAGVTAWILNERQEDEDPHFSSTEDYTDEDNSNRRPYAQSSAGGATTSNAETITLQSSQTETFNESTTTSSQRRVESRDVADGNSVYSRVSTAINRAPSPQQLLDGASKKVVAGIAAAGAAVGGVLSSIREEEKDDYVDHSRWSEEYAHQAGADPRTVAGAAVGTAGVVKELGGEVRSQVAGGTMAPLPPHPDTKPVFKRRDPNKKRKTVAVVLSAETKGAEAEMMGVGSYHDEQITLLDHLPSEIDHDSVQLFVLIYAPTLKQLPPLPSSPPTDQPDRGRDPSRPSTDPSAPASQPSISPSTGIATPRTPSLSFSPSSTTPQFSSLYSRACALVERPSMVLPFTSASGWVYLLRHIEPSLLYLQESFAGENGGQVSQVVSWVGQSVVVLGGEEGDGGLADDSDDEGPKKEKWWVGSEIIGLGKGVDIVDVMRLGEDWKRRVEKK